MIIEIEYKTINDNDRSLTFLSKEEFVEWLEVEPDEDSVYSMAIMDEIYVSESITMIIAWIDVILQHINEESGENLSVVLEEFDDFDEAYFFAKIKKDSINRLN